MGCGAARDEEATLCPHYYQPQKIVGSQIFEKIENHPDFLDLDEIFQSMLTI
jgi:hypothetical protein